MFNLLGRPKGVAALATASAIALVASISSAHAQEQQRSFNIPAQPLSSALLEFSRQSNIAVGVDPALVNGRQAPGVQGTLTPSEALNRLLAGSGLSAQQRPGGGFVLANASSPTQLGDASAAAPSEDGQRGYAEILVVGQRPTLNADIRRTEDDSQPYVVLDRADIERSGALNVEDLLRQRTTAATPFRSNAQSSGNTAGATSTINLRGLGADETLILIDGRRAAGYTNGGIPQQADINAIPVAAIERIEILPSTASGIYGGGATGGVINIILRRDYVGGEVSLQHGDTSDGQAPSNNFTVSGGRGFFEGRTRVTFFGGYAEDDGLLSGDRDFYSASIEAIRANNPAQFFAATAAPPLGLTTNIRSATGAMLTLKPGFGGGALNSIRTFVPVNYAGAASDNGAALIANAGQYNFDQALTAQDSGSEQNLLRRNTTWSANLSLRHRFAPWFDSFVDYTISENWSVGSVSPVTVNTLTISSASPLNPFNQNVLVAVPYVGVDQELESTLQTQRLLVGGLFDLPGDWRAAAELVWNGTELESGVKSALVTSSLTTAINTNAANAPNIFRDVNAFGTDFSPFVTPQGFNGPIATDLLDLSLRLSGPLPFALLAGTPAATFLLEHREESKDRSIFYSPTSFTAATRTLSADASQTVDSLYGELSVPILRFGDVLLEGQFAGRYDEYETDAARNVALDANFQPTGPIVRARSELSSFDPTVGLSLRFGEVAHFRASYGTGFLPPAVNQLVPDDPFAFPGSFLGLTDPQRGNEAVASFSSIGGGNPDLRPEETESLSYGLVVRAPFLNDLRFSVDWTRIEKTDAITTLGVSSTIITQLLQIAPERIIRDTNPATFGTFGVGPILAIDTRNINLSFAEIEALDFGIDYSFESDLLGAFDFEVGATQLLTSTIQASPVAPSIETAGAVTGIAGGVEWQGYASLSWQRDNWVASWTARYVGPYCTANGCPLIANLNSPEVESQTYHDLYLSYEINDQVRVFANGRNVFGEDPPLTGPIGGYSSFGDPRLTSYSVGVRASF